MKSNEKAAASLKHHRQLAVWEKALDLAAEVYRLSRALPSMERFGLTQQMRSAAVSIGANVAEGKGRTQPRDFARFIAMARGSAYELDTYIVLTLRLRYLQADEVAALTSLLDEVRRMLTGLLKRLTPYQRSL